MKTGILISESWNVREVSVTGIAAHGICRLCDCLGKVLQLYRNARCNCIAGKSSDTAITLVGIAAPQFHLEGIACRWSKLQGNRQVLNYKATVIVPTDPSSKQFHFVDSSVPRNYGAKCVPTYQSRRRGKIQRIASNLALDLKLKQPLECATRARLKARVKEIASWPKCRVKIPAKRTDNLEAKRSVVASWRGGDERRIGRKTSGVELR